ncbi:MAG TPA: hypothetical protein P5525_03925 [Candidatus Paceibacterota bacterium]|nr:hypothetical protein [Candidatus Paceibacterota bacterium]
MSLRIAIIGAGMAAGLYAIKFDPVSERRNFTTVKNPEFFKQQI